MCDCDHVIERTQVRTRQIMKGRSRRSLFENLNLPEEVSSQLHFDLPAYVLE